MNSTGLYVYKLIIIYWHIFYSSSFHHICNIKCRLDCRYSPQNIFNVKNFSPHKKADLYVKCAHLHPGYAANLVARSRYYHCHWTVFHGSWWLQRSHGIISKSSWNIPASAPHWYLNKCLSFCTQHFEINFCRFFYIEIKLNSVPMNQFMIHITAQQTSHITCTKGDQYSWTKMPLLAELSSYPEYIQEPHWLLKYPG